ncbi:MAG: DUF3619 family protein [Pseudomonadota bacterium]
MNEQYFVRKLKHHLNVGVHELPPTTLHALQTARRRALACQKQAAPQSVLAVVGGLVQHPFEQLQLRQVLIALLLLCSVVTFCYWHADQNITELEEIDSALLADDFPIGALTDRGFDVWLESTQSTESSPLQP